jgi:hypothetical protein
MSTHVYKSNLISQVTVWVSTTTTRSQQDKNNATPGISVLNTTLYNKVCQWQAANFFLIYFWGGGGTSVSSTNRTGHDNRTELLFEWTLLGMTTTQWNVYTVAQLESILLPEENHDDDHKDLTVQSLFSVV